MFILSQILSAESIIIKLLNTASAHKKLSNIWILCNQSQFMTKILLDWFIDRTEFNFF